MARVQLWHTCVLATFHYGLVAVNLTPPIITKYMTMVMTMFRQLMHDRSFRTRHTHQQVLDQYQLMHPIQLLLRHVP